MLYVDIPTLPEVKALVAARAPGSVSIYVPTTPLTQETKANRIELGNLAKTAVAQLEAAAIDKRHISSFVQHVEELVEDDEFWQFQANSLAVLATPDGLRTFRLPNRIAATAQVSDRFHLKPLLRAIAFPHEAFVLALAENSVRLLEVFADLPPGEVKIRDLPKTAADAVKRATVNDRSPSGRLQGSEGQKVLLRQFCRIVDSALRDVLGGRETPLILAATEPLASIYRSVATYPALAETTLAVSPGQMSEAELAAAATPLLDQIHARSLEAFRANYQARSSEGRTSTDLSDVARAATFGAVESLLVDIDGSVPGSVDERDGTIQFAKGESAKTYDIVDEIAGRALVSGARVLGVRKQDIPGGGSLAAVLRYRV